MKGMGKRVFFVAAVLVFAASSMLLVERAGEAAGTFVQQGKLNQFNGNFVEAEMVKAFITSIEYRQRFGP